MRFFNGWECGLRHLLAVVGFLLVLTAPVLAAAAPPVFDTPKALLDYAYAPYATGNFKDDTSLLYSSELNAQFAAADANSSEDSPGPIDFDVFVNAQDYQLTDLVIGDPVDEGTGMKVPVNFKNFGDAQSLLFHLIKEGGGWKINDIESLTPGSTWKLTTLLTPDNSPDDGSTDAAPADGSPGDGNAAGGSGDKAPASP